MNYITKKNFEDLLPLLFLISVFLFKIPNFYIIPGAASIFFTTQFIARFLIIAVFTVKIVYCLINKTPIFTKDVSKIVIALVLAFFAIQSLSVLSASNLQSFMTRYTDVAIGTCAFFVFYLFRNEYKRIIISLIASSIVSLLFQSLILISGRFVLQDLSLFISQNYFGYLMSNFLRGRISIETYDEIVIPFLFSYKTYSKRSNWLFRYTLIIAIIFFSLISNFRSRILMLLVGIGGSLITSGKLIIKNIALFALAVLIVGYFVSNISYGTFGVSFVDRFLLQDEFEDVETLSARVDQINTATVMGRSSLFGVGLGNYYDNLSSTKLYDSYSDISRGGREYVHNIFGSIIAESGYPSLVVFLVLLYFFAKEDILKIRRGESHEKAFVVSFWSLFSYSLFAPNVSVSYQVLFWGIRGILLNR